MEARWYPHVMFFVPATEDVEVGRQRSWRSDLRDHERCGTDHDFLCGGAQMVRREPRSLRSEPGRDDGEARNPSPLMRVTRARRD